MKRKYDVQLLDRTNGTFWTWEFNMDYEVAKIQAAHARDRGEVTKIIPHDNTPSIEDLM